MTYEWQSAIFDVATSLEGTVTSPVRHIEILNILRGRWGEPSYLRAVFSNVPVLTLWQAGVQHGIHFDSILDAYERVKRLGDVKNPHLDAALDARRDLYSGKHDLTDPITRKQLTPTAIRLFFQICSAWSLNDLEAEALLNDVRMQELHKMSLSHCPQLSTTALTRISYLVSCLRCLRDTYTDKLDDWWMKLPNSSKPFEGDTPLNFIIEGGHPALVTVQTMLSSQAGIRTEFPVGSTSAPLH